MSHKDGRVVLSAWVDPVLRDYVREAARLSGMEFSRWVERAVRQTMARESADRSMVREYLSRNRTGVRVPTRYNMYMDTTTLTAEELITKSITHTAIAHATFTSELAESLMVLSDDSAETAGVTEYWGTDDDGNEWRVHLERGDSFIWHFGGHAITVRIKPGPIPPA